MTIEEKAKAYDEALERTRNNYGAALEYCEGAQIDVECFKNTLMNIFPELAESEDEKVRKELLAFIKKRDRSGCDYDYDKWIAWLEKQKGCEYIKKDWLEHIKQSWYKEGFIDGKYSNKTPKEWTINDATTLNELIDFLENGTAKLQHDLTKYANWLKIQFTPFEKQG